MHSRTSALTRNLRVSMRTLVFCLPFCAACAGDGGLTFVRAVDPPPPQFASGPTLTGRTRELSFSTPEAVQAYCNRHLGYPPRGYYQACYIPALDLVVLPDRHAWPSARERAELRAHEWAHARGWRHGAPAAGSAHARTPPPAPPAS